MQGKVISNTLGASVGQRVSVAAKKCIAAVLSTLIAATLLVGCARSTDTEYPEQTPPAVADNPLEEIIRAEVERLPAPAVYLSADDVIRRLAQESERSHLATTEALKSLGLADAIDEIRSIDGVQLFDFEAEELVRELYRRAEVVEAGQGKVFLAALYQEKAREFPAVSEDPIFEPEREFIRAQGPPPALTELRFAASGSATDLVFSEPVERSIKQLAYIYSGEGLSDLSFRLRQAFNSPDLEISRLAASSDSTDAVLRKVIASHVPPPTPESAMAQLMRSTASDYLAVGSSQDFLETIMSLEERDLSKVDSSANPRRDRKSVV
jgi:hypothetical protein